MVMREPERTFICCSGLVSVLLKVDDEENRALDRNTSLPWVSSTGLEQSKVPVSPVHWTWTWPALASSHTCRILIRAPAMRAQRCCFIYISDGASAGEESRAQRLQPDGVSLGWTGQVICAAWLFLFACAKRWFQTQEWSVALALRKAGRQWSEGLKVSLSVLWHGGMLRGAELPKKHLRPVPTACTGPWQKS